MAMRGSREQARLLLFGDASRLGRDRNPVDIRDVIRAQDDRGILCFSAAKPARPWLDLVWAHYQSFESFLRFQGDRTLFDVQHLQAIRRMTLSAAS